MFYTGYGTLEKRLDRKDILRIVFKGREKTNQPKENKQMKMTYRKLLISLTADEHALFEENYEEYKALVGYYVSKTGYVRTLLFAKQSGL